MSLWIKLKSEFFDRDQNQRGKKVRIDFKILTKSRILPLVVVAPSELDEDSAEASTVE